MYVIPIYTMNGNVEKNSKKLLDPSFYTTPDNVDILKTMLAHKADPNIHHTDRDTPLHLSVIQKNSEYVSTFLAARAEPNKRNDDGTTPLHYAAITYQCKSVELLLNNKANPNLDNNSSQTPLHAALSCFVNPQIMELLLSAKTNPNLQNISGNTPLHKAVICSETPAIVKVAQLLLQYGTHTNMVNNKDYTPLQLLAHEYSKHINSLDRYSPEELPIARKMGRMLVWHHYILLPHFAKAVPREIACIIASHLALLCAQQPTIWS